MNTNSSGLALACEETETELQQLRDEVLSGLSETPKTLPSKLHFDERGSMLFDCLCTLPEFYPARAEMETLERHEEEIAEALGFDSMPIRKEFRRSQYSMTFLGFRERRLPQLPLNEYLWQAKGWGEYTNHQRLRIASDRNRSSAGREDSRRILYLPWCMVVSLHPAEMEHTLTVAGELCGCNGGILGVWDAGCKKLRAGLQRPLGYRSGRRLNGFVLPERDTQSIKTHFLIPKTDKLHLRSSMRQVIERSTLKPVQVEIGIQFSIEPFQNVQIETASGLRVERIWMDERETFSIQYLEPMVPSRSKRYKAQ